MGQALRAYIDLLRLQFFFAWPLLFCSGYLLATNISGGYSVTGLVTAVLIGFFGFEAGFVLNDYIDREYDKEDVESGKLTRYWRIFGTRPISEGLIPPRNAAGLFLVLVMITSALVLSLPFPHSLYVMAVMIACYALEAFYQVKKRDESFPIAQLIGRIDFALFPVAGYLAAGHVDLTAILYFAFFYPFAIAHLGINDLIDVNNDRARGMNTITTLYGVGGTAYWVAGFCLANIILGVLFMTKLGPIARSGMIIGFVLLTLACWWILKHRSPESGLKVLPLFHVTMLVYAGSVALDSIF